MGYQRPCGDVYIPSSWADHKNRNPPSSEPGTDYAVPVGTPVQCAGNGRVIDRKTSNSYATGRYVAVQLDDGRTVRYLHLHTVNVSVGARVGRGTVLAASGASGNGSDWYYGAHVHTTLWPGGYWEAPTIDFEAHAGDEPEPEPEEQEDTMTRNSGFTYVRSSDGRTVRAVVNTSSGFFAEWADDNIKVADIAAAFDAPLPFAPITEGYRNAIRNALGDVDQVEPSGVTLSAHPLTTPLWVLVAALSLIGAVELLRFILGLIIPG